MNTTDIGKEAEDYVSKYLVSKKHKILEMNWRNRWCEIDIVSKSKNCVYFTEVKYRSSDSWGEGLDYITPKKLKQMRFAAEFWIEDNKWNGEAVLLGASVDSNFEIELIEI